MTGTTPPPLHGPTSKEKKYDRQLRLWAASGQAALEQSHILLINSGPGVVGVETLKNLVLPGVGHFTILDSAIVTEADLGVNFFLEEEHLGGFRAEHSCTLLKELNPDVQGSYITEPTESFLSKPIALKPYTLILVTAPINPQLLSKLSANAATFQIPTFYIHCIGFYSQFSIHLPPAFPIVDTHPDPESTSDLRLLTPWPELSQFATEKTKGLQEMSHHDHGHVPYICLLLHYLEEWKSTHDGQVPQNYKDKTAFKASVAQGERRNNPEGGEENYDEAVAAVLKSLNPTSISSAVRDVFEAPECKSLTPETSGFWIIAHAMSIFYATHAVLPLPGSLPDMKAQSADYIQLQNVYKSKARHDLAEVLSTVRTLEKKLSRAVVIDEKEVEAFCKNAAHIKMVRGRPFHIVLPGETVRWGDRAKKAAQDLTDPESLILLYIAFLAIDTFIATHDVDGLGCAAKVAGGDDWESDTEEVEGIALKIIDGLINEAGTSIDEDEYSEIKSRAREYAQELVRAGGSELHNISALTGGLVAQEVIKVVTKQYIPVDNTCVFDGVRSKSSVLRF
ncbi:hypothetical protein K432DRAFT_423190 [Lepidopterella palustris CBS 459.81]|uniref:NEDD8-activating enzyme E1 regulatory subunit n=1 Tax=Lepidopterella palustris CBS 459.81 TaxID=1314670 RepID=A0A8E2EH17_9PEZI|nr:hypothetical protein K432DRAFT_423190 [Lepidopterella palustris CBS 459.81]